MCPRMQRSAARLCLEPVRNPRLALQDVKRRLAPAQECTPHST